MKNRRKTILGITIVSIIMLVIFVALKQQAQTQDDVAVIQQGRRITEREKAYDRAYGRSRHSKSKRLNQARIPGDFDVVVNAYLDSSNPVATKGQIIEKRVCNADAVIIGRAEGKTIHLNQEETLVYSEYDVGVQEIIKNNASLPIQTNNIIQITRPGGNIRFKGRLIRFIDGKYTPLTRGNYYLLFLKYVPEVNSFIPPDGGNDYLLDGNRAVPTILSSTKGKQAESEEASSLLNFIRGVAASSNCRQN